MQTFQLWNLWYEIFNEKKSGNAQKNSCRRNFVFLWFVWVIICYKVCIFVYFLLIVLFQIRNSHPSKFLISYFFRTLILHNNRKILCRKSLYCHKRASHDPDMRKHKCDECQKAFLNPSQLERHKLTHSGIKPFKVRFCLKFCKFCLEVWNLI